MTAEGTQKSENREEIGEKVIIGLEIHAYLNTKSKLFCSCTTSPGASAWVKPLLEAAGAEFEFVEHEAVTRPIDSARVRNVDIKQIAKALVYMVDDKPILLILSGDRKASNEKVKAVLNANDVRMATPDEVKEHTGCIVGLVPPIIKGLKKILDTRLVEQDLWSFNAGIATAGIKIQKEELMKVIDNYSAAEISEDELIVEENTGKPTKIHEMVAEPNTATCPVCLGHPGSKPVLNEKAVELATKVGLALNCNINKDFFFSRKTYFYPDMAMNYQITQYEVPVAEKGHVTLPNGKKIGITRAHVEWDPAALVHPQGMGKSNYVQIDYNRSGLPLIEIVTEPDLESAKEAREFLNYLENILKYLNVLKLGSTLKVDSNISIYPNDRVEIKNISGYAAVEKALNFELLRQRREMRMGKKVEQHTRAFNAENGTTVELRKKESESDYGYIFDPDLVKVSLTDKQVEEIRKDMPELPEAKAIRFQNDYGLNDYDARVITSDKELGDLFAELAQKSDAQTSARLLTRELLSILNHDSLSLTNTKISISALSELIDLIKEGKVSDKNTKQAMINYISGDKSTPKDFLEKNNLLISGELNIDEIVAKVLSSNPQAVDEFKGGNEKSLNFLMGLVMRETKGTVSPQQAQELLKKKIGG